MHIRQITTALLLLLVGWGTAISSSDKEDDPAVDPPSGDTTQIGDTASVDDESTYVDGFIADGKKATYSPAELVSNITYPHYARRHDIEGRVALKIFLGKDGSVHKLKIIEVRINDAEGMKEKVRKKVIQLFSSAARRAIIATSFKPATQHGEPIRSGLVVVIRFRLE